MIVVAKAESSMVIASEESSSVEKDSVSPAEAGSSVGVSISPPLPQADSRTSIMTSARAEMIFPPAFRRGLPAHPQSCAYWSSVPFLSFFIISNTSLKKNPVRPYQSHNLS